MDPLSHFAVAQAEHRARVARAERFGHLYAAPVPEPTPRLGRRLTWRRPLVWRQRVDPVATSS